MIKTDKVEFLVTQEDFTSLMNDYSKLEEENKKLLSALETESTTKAEEFEKLQACIEELAEQAKCAATGQCECWKAACKNESKRCSGHQMMSVQLGMDKVELEARIEELSEALNALWEYIGVDCSLSQEQAEFIRTHREEYDTIESVRPDVRTKK